ncbi:MAG: hypothetical protein RMY29_021165, partial [Nostoc sp. CreGUA01]
HPPHPPPPPAPPPPPSPLPPPPSPEQFQYIKYPSKEFKVVLLMEEVMGHGGGMSDVGGWGSINSLSPFSPHSPSPHTPHLPIPLSPHPLSMPNAQSS